MLFFGIQWQCGLSRGDSVQLMEYTDILSEERPESILPYEDGEPWDLVMGA